MSSERGMDGQSPEFDPSSPLFVGDILDSIKSNEAFEQDSREALKQASRTVLAELEAQGIDGIPKLTERISKLEAAEGQQAAALSRVALQYFSDCETLPPGKERDENLRLGCLSEVVQCIAVSSVVSGYTELEYAHDKLMEHARFLGSKTHKILYGYIDRLSKR